MKIKQVTLKNIRSYTDGTITIPDGRVLFTGDIGSGKTSVLLALEFALFGARRGSASLLRNGVDAGEVQINFSVGTKEFEIKRVLKRTKKGVSVSECWVGSDGDLSKLSTTELKQQVLKLFGYPQSMLGSNPIVYRYTVYTPQEQMKHIIQTDTETRLETIRKIFAVDKYKLIKDNTKVLVSFLNNRKTTLEGRIYDLDEKKQALELKKQEVSKVVLEQQTLKPEQERIKTLVLAAKQDREKIEQTITELKDKKHQLTLIETKQEHLMKTIQDCKTELEKLTKELMVLEEAVEGKETVNLDEPINNLKQELMQIEKDVETKQKIQYACTHETERAEETITKITELDECPMCKQIVITEHKTKIEQEQQQIITTQNQQRLTLDTELGQLQIKRENAKTKQEELTKQQQEGLLIQHKQEQIKQLTERKQNLNQEREDAQKTIASMHDEKQQLFTALEQWDTIETKFNETKQTEEEIQQQEQIITVKVARLEEAKKTTEEIIKNLDVEIKRKEQAKTYMQQLSELVHFLKTDFINVVQDVEKNVMVKIHHDFDQAFRKWFGVLVGSDELQVRTDFSFNPLIEHNGYETDYESLSGGERTAAALAYRLALNQAVNAMADLIQTKELLILDEPTDGFSAEQLERLKLVLDQLPNEQVIIVSHEPRIEQFVESVLRFQKVNGETVVST